MISYNRAKELPLSHRDQPVNIGYDNNAVCCDNYKKHINIMYDQNSSRFNVKADRTSS